MGFGGPLGWVKVGARAHPTAPCCPPIPQCPCPPQDTGLASTSLRTLTERLRELAQGTQSLVLRGSPGGAAPQPPPVTLLAHVVDLLGAAKGLFSWLNRSGWEVRAPMGAGCPRSWG